MTAYIYYLPNCPKCKMTVNLFNKSSINVVTAPLSDLQKKKMITKGWHSAPLVEIHSKNKLIDEWNDFRPERIKQYMGV